MPCHIRRRATRQRADLAGSLRDGAYFRQGRVEKGLWGPAPRRLPLLTLTQIRPAKRITNSFADPNRALPGLAGCTMSGAQRLSLACGREPQRSGR